MWLCWNPSGDCPDNFHEVLAQKVSRREGGGFARAWSRHFSNFMVARWKICLLASDCSPTPVGRMLFGRDTFFKISPGSGNGTFNLGIIDWFATKGSPGGFRKLQGGILYPNTLFGGEIVKHFFFYKKSFLLEPEG